MFQPSIYNEYKDIELPVIPVLADMELHGSWIDAAYRSFLRKYYQDKQDEAAAHLAEYAGAEVNLNAPAQVSAFIFDTLGITPAKLNGKIPITDSGNISTDKDYLLELEPHPALDYIITWKEYGKLIGTYVTAFEERISPHTGKLHTSFNQDRTASSRLSSSKPNLQNVPARREDSKLLRRAFVPSRGNVMLSADFSQMELKAETEFSQDPVKLEIFNRRNEKGHLIGDIHDSTSQMLFGALPDYEEHKGTYRKVTKTMVFGGAYRAEAPKLSLTARHGGALWVTVEVAKDLIKKQRQLYKGSEQFYHDYCKLLDAQGYSDTMYGFRRYLPALNSVKHMAVEEAYRKGYNHCVPLTTQAIARNGFTPYDQLQVGDEILTYANDGLVWSRIKQLVFNESMPLFELGHRRFATTASSGHRWVMEDDTFRTTEELHGQRTSRTHLRLAATLTANTDSPLSPREAAILGWLITDGHIAFQARGRIHAHIFQSERVNAHKCARIRELLGEDLAHERLWSEGFSSGVVGFRVATPFLRSLLQKAGLGKDYRSKGLVELVLRLDYASALAFLTAARDAEGSGPDSPYIAQIDGHRKDAIVLAATLCGYHPTVYRTGLHLGKPYTSLKGWHTQETASAAAWCPVTETGTWVAYDGYQTFITGNCIQGTCAGMVKLTMIRLWHMMRESHLRSRFFLQIHDELVFDAVPEEIPLLWPMIQETFCNFDIIKTVPMTTSIEIGPNWLDASSHEVTEEGGLEEAMTLALKYRRV